MCYLSAAVLESFIFYHLALHIKTAKTLWEYLNLWEYISQQYLL
jgi:hypothetical protein